VRKPITIATVHASSQARDDVVVGLSWAGLAVGLLVAVGSSLAPAPGRPLAMSGRSNNNVAAVVLTMSRAQPTAPLPLGEMTDPTSVGHECRCVTLDDTLEYFNQMPAVPLATVAGQDALALPRFH